MLDIHKCFSEIDGHIFEPDALRKRLEQLLAKHRGELPPEFDVQALYELGREESIIINGKYSSMIKIPKEPLYAKF
mgnify:CR=1 FL=1